MCHGCTNNSKINRQHKRCSQMIYSDKQSSFETLFEKDGSVFVQNRNPQILSTEMYIKKNDLGSLIVTELFEQRNKQHYDLSNNSQFTVPPIKTVYHGLESILFPEPKI